MKTNGEGNTDYLKIVSVRLSLIQIDHLKNLSKETRQTMGGLIREAINSYFRVEDTTSHRRKASKDIPYSWVDKIDKELE